MNFSSISATVRLVILAVLAVAIIATVWTCTHRGQKAAQGAQDARSSKAMAETAKDAAETVVARSEADADIDELVTETAKEIDNAPSDEAAGIAARAAICRMPSYRDDPGCRVP